MATMTIDARGAVITMDNGAVIAIPPGYESITIGEGARPEVISYPGGRDLWVTSYAPNLIEGLVAGLTDGRTFRSNDGASWTRCGDEMVVKSPGQSPAPWDRWAANRQRAARRNALPVEPYAEVGSGVVLWRRAA